MAGDSSRWAVLISIYSHWNCCFQNKTAPLKSKICKLFDLCSSLSPVWSVELHSGTVACSWFHFEFGCFLVGIVIASQMLVSSLLCSGAAALPSATACSTKGNRDVDMSWLKNLVAICFTCSKLHTWKVLPFIFRIDLCRKNWLNSQ